MARLIETLGIVMALAAVAPAHGRGQDQGPAPSPDTNTSAHAVSGVEALVVIQPADWIYFPRNFPLPRIAGQVVLKCKVLPTTLVSDCSVASDTEPSGILGRAALKASALFKIKPRMVNGTLSDDAWVLIPISFNSAAPKK